MLTWTWQPPTNWYEQFASSLTFLTIVEINWFIEAFLTEAKSLKHTLDPDACSSVSFRRLEITTCLFESMCNVSMLKHLPS